MAERNPQLALVVSPGRRAEVEWFAPGWDPGDLGSQTRGLLQALMPLLPGLRLEDVPISPPSLELNLEQIGTLEAAAARKLEGPAISVVALPLGSTFQRAQHGCYAVAVVELEADRLPQAWVAAANKLDEIWVHSEFDRQGLLGSGVTTPVVVIPTGVDDAKSPTSARSPSASRHPEPAEELTRFVSPSMSLVGADLDAVLVGWAAAFERYDPVQLVVRSNLDETQFAHRVRAVTGRSVDELAPVSVVANSTSASQLAALWEAADVVVVAGHNGALRACTAAMAAGKLVIAPRWGASGELVNDTNGLPVDIEGLATIAAPGLSVDGLRRAVPSLASLVGQLRAATHPGVRASLADAGARSVEALTWEAAAERVAQRVGEIWEELQARHAEPGSGLRVRWQGDHFRHTSLSNVNRATSLGLIERGCRVQVISNELPEIAPHGDPALRPLVEATDPNALGEVDVEVHFEWPPRFERSGPHPLVIFQPWEFGPIPDEWVAHAGDVDEFWTPSSWSRECFVMSGVPTDKVKVLPHGIDTKLYCPPGPRMPLRTKKQTKLLFVGGLIWRKGIDILLNAYLSTFTAADDVCLVIKSTDFYSGSGPDQIRTAIRQARERGMAEIEFIEEDLSEEAMAGLYRACDVLVHPYRGEGFGLPVLEAMGCGLAVAVTAYGACMDFCDSTTATLIPCGIQGGVDAGGPQLKVSKPGFHAEPDPADLGSILRRLVGDPAGNALRAARALERVEQDYTIEASVEMAHAYLSDLVRRFKGKNEPAGERAQAELVTAGSVN